MSYIGTEPKDIRSFGRTKFDYTATQGQTAFTGADDDGKVLAFTVGQIEVYVNGILMDDSDFTTTGTGTVTLASAANLNDVINIVSFESNIPDNDYVPASGGTFTGNVTNSGTVTNSGNVTVGGTLGVTGATTMSGDLAITKSDASITPDADADDFVIEGNQAIGMTIGSSASSVGSIRFADSGSPRAGMLYYSHITDEMRLYTSANSRFTINSSGHVTMPNQPAWVVYANSRTGWTNTGIQKTPYDSVLHAEPSSAYSTTNFRYTAPVAGRYWVQVSQNGISDIILYIYKNGSVYHGGEYRSNPTGAWEHYVIGTVINLAANDYVEAYVNLGNSGGNAWNGGTSTWDQFSGFLIG